MAPPPSPARQRFDQRVFAAVAQIPPGRVATYGQIAELIGAYGCARQVGWALRRLPMPSALPWHRVVNARGLVSMSPGREGSDWMQCQLLLAEGIPVDHRGRLPLARCRWQVDRLPGAMPAEAAAWLDLAPPHGLAPRR